MILLVASSNTVIIVPWALLFAVSCLLVWGSDQGSLSAKNKTKEKSWKKSVDFLLGLINVLDFCNYSKCDYYKL